MRPQNTQIASCAVDHDTGFISGGPQCSQCSSQDITLTDWPHSSRSMTRACANMCTNKYVSSHGAKADDDVLTCDFRMDRFSDPPELDQSCTTLVLIVLWPGDQTLLPCC